MLLLLLFTLTLVPRKRLTSPAWDVIVLDDEGSPQPGIHVTETAEDYSCENQEHVFTSFTDNRGRAHFTPTSNRRPLITCLTQVLSDLGQGVHGSFGQHVRVDVPGVVCVKDKRGSCVDWTGSPQHMTSTVRGSNTVK